MLLCERAQAQMHDLLDGTLRSVQAVTLVEHLADCKTCRQEFQALQFTQNLLRGEGVPDSAASRDRVLAKFRSVAGQEVRKPVVSRWRFGLLPMGLTAAAAAIVIVLTVLPTPMPLIPNIVQGPQEESTLPSAGELDKMTSLHAAQSTPLLGNGTELDQETLADTSTRLIADGPASTQPFSSQPFPTQGEIGSETGITP